jgi:hypothetical protein
MACSSITEYDLELYQGDDTTLKFRYTADSLPVDLTGYVIDLECSESLLSKTATIAPDQVLNIGEYEFVYVPADTQDIEGYRLKYELVFYPNGLGGTKVTKLRGSLLLTKEFAA